MEYRQVSLGTGSMSMTPNGFRLQLSILIGAQGLGLQLADETDHVVIRGFRPGSPAQQAGVKLGDFVREINGMPFTSFQEAITKLKSPNMGMVTLTLERTS
jgi:C-terminal processing protease CtpA/Prc